MIGLVEGPGRAVKKGIPQVQLSHGSAVRSVVFDQLNLIGVAGLVPAVALAQRAGLIDLVDEHVTVPGGAGHAAGLKVSALVAGMVAGADSIADMDLLRHGGMGRVFDGSRAPSTLGTFLRAFTFGHVRQLDAVAARFLVGLCAAAPIIDPTAAITYLDIDDTVRAVHGYQKQGVGYGYSKVKGLNALIGTVSSAGRAPIIVAGRLRKGAVHSARGAPRLVTDALVTTARCRVAGPVVLRADSAFYNAKVIAAARRRGAHFSITARKDKAVTKAIATIDDGAWTAITYPRAVIDEQSGQLISDAEVAEIPFTAFASRGKSNAVTARLIVRRVRDQNPAHVTADAQGELFPMWRHHAVFTDSPLPTLTAEADHRRHAIIEQVIADLKNGPLAHLPSGSFAANSAWLALAAIAFNLTRALGSLAGGDHAVATTATVRTRLIAVPARITRSARHTSLRGPDRWPWANAFIRVFNAATGPPTAT